jgi:V8-like Glu-specific endopeptidase
MTLKKFYRLFLLATACMVVLTSITFFLYPARSEDAAGKEVLGKFRIDSNLQRIKDEQNGPSDDSADTPENLQSPFGNRAIYGKDTRLDWGQIKPEKIKAIARSSVALFREISLVSVEGRKEQKFGLLARTLGEQSFDEARGARLCKSERFTAQLVVPICSGVLVGEDLVVTAGHCIKEASHDRGSPALDSLRFVFGFTAKNEKDRGQSEFDARQIFRGIELVGSGYTSKENGSEDWAVVRLDRKVSVDIASPVKNIRTTNVKKGERVYAIGYPTGLPLKYVSGARISDDKPGAKFFIADLSVFQGNSGSGVFLSGTNELIGILVRGDRDYYLDENAGRCARAYICDLTKCTGEAVTRIQDSKIQAIISGDHTPQ